MSWRHDPGLLFDTETPGVDPYWIYTDAVTGQVHMGAGKHCGTPLDRVPSSYLDWILSKERAWDTSLTEETRSLFSDQKKRGVR